MFLGAAARAEDGDIDFFIGPLHTADGRMGKGPGGHHRTGRGACRLDETPTAHLACCLSSRLDSRNLEARTWPTRVNVGRRALP